MGRRSNIGRKSSKSRTRAGSTSPRRHAKNQDKTDTRPSTNYYSIDADGVNREDGVGDNRGNAYDNSDEVASLEQELTGIQQQKVLQ